MFDIGMTSLPGRSSSCPGFWWFGVLFRVKQMSRSQWLSLLERRGTRKLSSLLPFSPLNLDALPCRWNGPALVLSAPPNWRPGQPFRCSQGLWFLNITHQRLHGDHEWSFWVLLCGLLLLYRGGKENRTGHWSHGEGEVWSGQLAEFGERILRGKVSQETGWAPTRDHFAEIEWLPWRMGRMSRTRKLY